LGEISPTKFSDRLHPQHLELGLPKSRRPVRALISGVKIGCRSPRRRGPYSTPIHTRCRSPA
jgi:hypothetical protein